MKLQEQINQDLIQAMKNKEELRLSTLRMVKTALKNRQVDLQRELEDTDALQVMKTLIKQRQDSVEQYTQAGRNDLAKQETMEIGIIEQYLPPMPSQTEIERVVDDTIRELGATSMKDMGPVMKAVMGELATAVVDGKAISETVRSRLSSGRTD
jgi:uncharacterized protein